VVVENDLIRDDVKPGDRLQIFGVLKTFMSSEINGHFNLTLIATSVEKIEH